MPHDTSLEQRIQALEDREAIRALKSHYFAVCDAKNPEGMRACFVDGPVDIDYGAIGCFDNADALVAVFQDIGCHPHMVEMHHGLNPRIRLTGPDEAEGDWALQYQLINTRDMTLTQLGARYEDRYRRTSEGWKIAATRCIVHSTLVVQLGEDALRRVMAGAPPQGALDAA